jgi:polo-like kinase 1
MTTQPDLLGESQIIVEERIVKANGESLVRKYIKGRFLGKGGFAKCFEFINVDTKKMSAAKVIGKATLSKHRAKQKVRF